MKVKIKIKFENGNKYIELSEEKAKKLYYKLDEYFGKKDIWLIPYQPVPNPYWTNPIITYGDNTGDPLPIFPKIICYNAEH